MKSVTILGALREFSASGGYVPGGIMRIDHIIINVINIVRYVAQSLSSALLIFLKFFKHSHTL